MCVYVFLCNMLNNILQRFHKTSTASQTVELDLCDAVDLTGSLRDYVANRRNSFDNFESDTETCLRQCPDHIQQTQEKEKTSR